MKTQRKPKPATANKTRARSHRALEEAGDPLSLLKVGHRKVEDLLERYEVATSTDEKVVLAKKVCAELMTQTTLEEEILLATWPRDNDNGQRDIDYLGHPGR